MNDPAQPPRSRSRLGPASLVSPAARRAPTSQARASPANAGMNHRPFHLDANARPRQTPAPTLHQRIPVRGGAVGCPPPAAAPPAWVPPATAPPATAPPATASPVMAAASLAR